MIVITILHARSSINVEIITLRLSRLLSYRHARFTDGESSNTPARICNRRYGKSLACKPLTGPRQDPLCSRKGARTFLLRKSLEFHLACPTRTMHLSGVRPILFPSTGHSAALCSAACYHDSPSWHLAIGRSTSWLVTLASETPLTSRNILPKCDFEEFLLLENSIARKKKKRRKKGKIEGKRASRKARPRVSMTRKITGLSSIS